MAQEVRQIRTEFLAWRSCVSVAVIEERLSDSSRYIRLRAQYAARRLVLVKVDLPKGTGGLTGHAHASQSHDGAARTGWDGGGWRVAVFRSVNLL